MLATAVAVGAGLSWLLASRQRSVMCVALSVLVTSAGGTEEGNWPGRDRARPCAIRSWEGAREARVPAVPGRT